MLVELVKRWKGYRVGKQFDMQDGAAKILIQRGMAKDATDKPTDSDNGSNIVANNPSPSSQAVRTKSRRR